MRLLAQEIRLKKNRQVDPTMVMIIVRSNEPS
jgi:hypothetical protein